MEGDNDVNMGGIDSKENGFDSSRDNSNDNQTCKESSLNGTVIRVEGDGRCLFRSLVTCLSSDLQKARRDDFGCPVLKHDANYETLMSDALRARVVKLMKDNIHFYNQLERTVINADQPVPSGYRHFLDRLRDMTSTATMPGDLELNATSTAIEKQILVVDCSLNPIVLYGKDQLPQTDVVVVRFTRLGSFVGHYDAVIPDLTSLLKMGLDPGLNWCRKRTTGPIEPVRMEIDACFGTCLIQKPGPNDHNINISSNKSTQALSQQDSPMDDTSSNNKTTTNSNTSSNGAEEGTSTIEGESTCQETKCKQCCVRSSAHDVLMDLLIDQFVFVPGPTSEYYGQMSTKGSSKKTLNTNSNKTSDPSDKDIKNIPPNSKVKVKVAGRQCSDPFFFQGEKKCLVCKRPATKGQKIVTCILCLRAAHQNCIMIGDCDIEMYHCSFCTTTFKDV